MSNTKNNKIALLIIPLVITITSILLYWQGRSLICTCGKVFLWVGDIWSSDNSQHIFDPYSFTHLLHGFLFSWILILLAKKVPYNWQIVIVVVLESLWELVENSNFVINRYRENTLALGYQGDTIINSISDIFACSVGFIIAKYLGFKKSFIVFVIIELILLFWIRDNLTLNIIMLIYPIKEIKQWQMGK
ncbi:MAG: DUF2585 family protein [Acidobacteria bacterium]|nr:DUF2585 family protein [Acidobacteriota bacterium]